MPKYNLSVNGKSFTIEADADTPVLWVPRDHLNQLQTKEVRIESFIIT